MMRKNIYQLFVILTVSVLLVTNTVSYALSQTTNFKAVSSEVTEWATYTDPRFDFSVSYPADWIIIPREDSYGVGGTLTFVSSNHLLEESDSHIAPPKIEIGMYLVARDKTLSLKEWTDRYNLTLDN